jgi:hypothetical protein
MFLATTARAQIPGSVVVANPKQLPVASEHVPILFDLTRRVAAEKFKLKPEQMPDLRLKLVLGMHPTLGFRAEDDGSRSLFLPKWRAGQFSYGVMYLTLNYVPPEKQTVAFLREVLRRFDRIAPVTADRLKVEGQVFLDPQPESLFPDFLERPRGRLSLRIPLRAQR